MLSMYPLRNISVLVGIQNKIPTLLGMQVFLFTNALAVTYLCNKDNNLQPFQITQKL